jgi:predicted component of type VI protein secretion system
MATKKISELPLITTLSGSQVDGGSVLPVVVGGTTNQISVENFSRFATAYSATTSSNNFLGTQNITGNVSITGVETVTGTLNVVGGGSVSGDFSIGGKLTVQELHTELTSASILFESGSTILGNTADDTHTVTGTILLNGQALGTGQLNAYTGSLLSQTTLLSTFTTSINLATSSLNLQTGSQDLVNRRISSTTGSINTTTSSFDSVFLRISSTTGSINTTTSSFNSVFLGISSVTGAMNTQSSSQNLVNLAISTYTGSQNIINSSVDSHILKQASQTGSQDLVNLGISSVTGSLIGITNGLMAFTSALDNTYATDAQLYQLYQATASIQAFTSSQDSRNFTISQITSSIDAHILKQAIQTGSQDLVNLGISTFTGSQNVINNSIDAHILKQAIQTGSQDLVNLGISTYTGSQNVINTSVNAHILKQAIQTGSQDLVNLGISTYTGSQNVINSSVDAHILKQAIQTGSQDLVNLGISTYTGSQNVINTSVNSHILAQSTQTGSQDLVNLGISTFTGSLRSEVNLIEAYTASLKNAFTIDGNNDVYFTGKITTQEVHTTYTTSSVLFQSGSTKFGNSSDDIHEFTGSKFEVLNSDTSGTMYAVVKNNRARNAAVQTTTTNGSFIAGTSIGTDAFQYQIYDAVEGVNRVTINSQGGTTLQGAVSASQTLRVTGKTQIGTSTVDTSLGSNTKLSVVGDGSVNAGASQGSMFVGAGVTGGDTGLPLNMGTAGATMMLLASINTSTGTSTNSATYVLQFYFDGNNVPNAMFLTGSSNFVTFAATPSNTLAISGSSSGNKSYAWFINKFGA